MILLNTTTDTGAGTYVSSGMRLKRGTAGAEVELNVTAAATDATDTLDVYIQSSIDNGVTWDDLIHFTQVLGNGGAKKLMARWQGEAAPTVTTTTASRDATLAASSIVQGPKGLFWRVKRVVVATNAPVFTLAVYVGAVRLV